MFDEIIGNEPIKNELKRAVDENKVSHSYMFVGIEGIGKQMIAKEFAQIVLCTNEEEKGCHQCKSCVEFMSHNHPDFLYLEPDGSSIKIEQIVIQETETPNADVNEAFRDVNSALNEKDSKILIAKKEASKTITQTDGEVATILNKAQSIADSKLYTVKGECDRIKALSAQYNANPTLTKRTLYLEMVKTFLSKYGSNIVIVEGNNNINVIPLNELFGKGK